jgi:hypothetical protein
MRHTQVLALGVVLFWGLSARAADLDRLQRNFRQPPDDAKIMMRWWWFGPAVTKPRLEREMKQMKAGGIGGFEVQPTYPLALDGEVPGLVNLKFMSPEFLDCLAFTAKKAKELGLRMDLTLGSGWPYGGPQFPRSEAAGRLVLRHADVAEGQKSVPLPQLQEGEKVVAAFVGPLPKVPEGENPYKEVPLRDGAAQIPDAYGPVETASGKMYFSFYIASQTRMQVKRAAFGDEGYVIDHYSPAVIGKFIEEIADPEIKACGSNPPYAVFCDSLEVGGEDWTYDFLDEFKKRRGYDLRPWLPALYTDIGPKTLDIRYDWGRTLTELFDDYFDTAFEKWARQHKTRFRIQGYGTPPATLYSYTHADLCEAEGFQWKSFEESRWAASASHLLGRPVTSSETWTWLHQAVFLGTPLDMKAEANLHFLQGINQLIGHGWPYTAEGVAYPGWRFYAAGVFNEKNPWWIVMPDVAEYLQRVSFMMRQGTPANDVALYLPESDAWANFVPGSVSMNATISRMLNRSIVSGILDAGFNLDFLDDGLLAARGKVKGDTLAFGDVKYRVVILPAVERIPVATLRTLESFAKTGGIVMALGNVPSRAPGFLATEKDQQAVRDISARLFEGPKAKGILVASEDRLGQALAERLQPDVQLSPAEPEIGFVHRTLGNGEIYFVANTANTPKSVKAKFRVAGLTPQMWDPMSGQIRAAQRVDSTKKNVTVALDLAPFESTILLFSKRHEGPREPLKPGESARPLMDLSKDWTVTFGAETRNLESLQSWTDDPNTRYFSGTAIYHKTVGVPSDMLANGLRIQLTLGEGTPSTGAGEVGRGSGNGFRAAFDAPVREAAVVYVNGKRAGSVWCPPYVVDVTGLLTSGENEIRIDVANLAVNYMSDFEKHPLPDYTALRAKYGNRFDPQGMNLIRPTTSGLLGPIQLVATRSAER